MDDFFFIFLKNPVFGYLWSTWKPNFLMDRRPLVEGCIANFGIFHDNFEFYVLEDFFRFQKIQFLGILGLPYCGIGATIRIGQETL